MSPLVEVAAAGRRFAIEYAWVGPADGPTVVFLHEGLGSVSMWRDFPARLCEALGMRGLVYSRPGYGRSTPRAAGERWRVDFMHVQAREVLPALLEALRVPPHPWLFGHSDGASIALIYAATFPAVPAGVVALAPHLFVEDVSVASIEAIRKTYLATDLRARLARHHDDPDSAFFGWNDIWLDTAFRAWSIEAGMEHIRCPVLAIQGEDDEYGTMAQVDRIAALVPAARLLKLSACGHSPQRDQPQRVIDAFGEFLRDRVTDGASGRAGG
ncbi:MAG: alpha/beta hydrolase [Burkholderiales bacterium]